MTIVDIHCHTFNADDLPVRGFLRRTRFDDSKIGDLVSALADRLLQTDAPGFVAERRKLDAMLGITGLTEAPSLESTGPGLVEEFESDVDRAMRDLAESDPELLGALAEELAPVEPGAEEGIFDAVGASRRVLRWVMLFGEYRVTNTALLVSNFSDEVGLYTPLIVDLDAGLHDTAKTTIRQQVELHEKISRLSMLGLLDGAVRARIHPFVGFDPRREVLDRRSGEIEPAFEVVKASIYRYGFVGVKVYPPMGFKPIDNGPTVDMDAQMASDVNNVLAEFFAWCEAEQVPITAHCNRSNEAHDSYIDFSAPEYWEQVLVKHPTLHLNLGHFGGAAAETRPDAWPWQIARLVRSEFPFLFADVGNHRIYDDKIRNGYFAMLRQMFQGADTAEMANRIMFGSDWFMLAVQPQHGQFLSQYRSTYQESFGDEATASFMGDAALQLLGFDDPGNKNAQRLRQRYEQHAPTRIPDWLAV